MGNLIRSPKEFLLNSITGTEFGIGYNAKTGKMYFQDKINGIIIEGRAWSATMYDTTNSRLKLTGVTGLAKVVDMAWAKKSSTGTARQMTLTPTSAATAAGKNVTVFVISVPDFKTPATPSQAVRFSRMYSVKTDEAGTTATNICNALRDLINADQDSIVSATSSLGTLVLTAKDANVLFNVSSSVEATSDVWATSVLAFTVVVNQIGVKPSLTYRELAKKFSIKSWEEGALKDFPVNADYVKVHLKYKIQEHPAVDIANALTSLYDEVMYYIPYSQYNNAFFNPQLLKSDGTAYTTTAPDGTLDFHTNPASVSSDGLKLSQLLEYTIGATGALTIS